MKIRAFFQFFFLLLLSFSLLSKQAIAAEAIDSMYEASVPLADRSIATRRAALRSGLAQVLTRYTGYSRVASLPGVGDALDNAESYVVEFSVEAIQAPLEDRLATERAEALWVRYNASQVDDLANRLQLPIWSALRPSVQYLIVKELWEEPRLMSSESYPAMTETLERVFTERGLPHRPLEQPVLDAETIWQLSDIDAYQLLQESAADMLFLVRVVDTDEPLGMAELLVVQPDSMSVFRENTGDALDDVHHAINSFVDSYSVDYAYLGGLGQSTEFFISVLGLEDFSAYRQILDLISELEQVTQTRLEGYRDKQMLFRVSYNANPDRLVSEIARRTGLAPFTDRALSTGTRDNPFYLATENHQAFEITSIFQEPVPLMPLVPVEESPLEADQPQDSEEGEETPESALDRLQ